MGNGTLASYLSYHSYHVLPLALSRLGSAKAPVVKLPTCLVCLEHMDSAITGLNLRKSHPSSASTASGVEFKPRLNLVAGYALFKVQQLCIPTFLALHLHVPQLIAIMWLHILYGQKFKLAWVVVRASEVLCVSKSDVPSSVACPAPEVVF
ncbi:hypothetical protein BGY98DRAFT_937707 [Russula aff. rugulosa BPL654]|nr:hypothetical protein BGY98DRAFT_937707 [Russula aff. rugulosa BPL654]